MLHVIDHRLGILSVQVGKQDLPTLTQAAEAKPRWESIKALPDTNLPFPPSQIVGGKSGDFTTVSLPLAPGERLYGLGLQMHGMDRRGGVYHLRVDHYAGGHDRLHVPSPLYISSRGYAVMFNTSRPVDIYLGVGNRLDDPHFPTPRDRNTDPKWDSQPDSGHVEASVQGPGLEVIVFSGPTPMNALQRYNLYCGGGPMPPLWALGFWNRTPALANAKDVLQEIGEYHKRGLPLDVIGLEPGWQSRAYPGSMEWSKERFPEPAEFLKETSAAGVKVNLWENPYIAPGTDLFKQVSPNFASHTVWLGAAPDLQIPAASRALADFHKKEHLDLGVSGYKIDEIDGFDFWLWPDHASFPSKLDGLRMRQIYGLLWQDRIDNWFRAEKLRTFGLIRGSNAAASRFPFAIYSDTYDPAEYLTASINASLAGVLWCAEARDASNGEEWVRRMQAACLSSIAQLNAWASGTKPWSFPEVEGAVKNAMLLRESLAPYLYTTYAQYWREGIPPIRPMSLVDGGLETDQYLLGDNLLVAPMFPGQKVRTVRLPAGKWVEYETGVAVEGTITVKPPLDVIPIYVKENAAIPMFPPDTLNLSTLSPETPYMLKLFGPGPWHGKIYEDDGSTFGYEKGDFGFFEVQVNRDHSAHIERTAGNRIGSRAITIQP